MTKEPEIILDWITVVNDYGRDLTKWEEDFMESITEQFRAHNWISDKQEEILERIYLDSGTR